MKRYEKDLKRLQALTKNGSEPTDQESANLDDKAARLLSAMGFIDLIPAGDNEFWITLTDDGVTYFIDKANARADFVKNHLANFVVGFLSGVLATVAAALIRQAVLR